MSAPQRLQDFETADDIAAWTAAWHKGQAEMWRASMWRPSIVTKGEKVWGGIDAPTLEGLQEAIKERLLAGWFLSSAQQVFPRSAS